MLYRTYEYYETNEDGEIVDKIPSFVTLKANVDIKPLEKELGATFKLINEFDFKFKKSEFYKFDRRICKDRFANYLPTFISFDPDPEIE